MSRLWESPGWRSALTRGIAAASIVIVAAVGCGGTEERGGAVGDTAAGEVAALNYEVTPDRYQRWVSAQQSLDAIPGLPAPPRIDPLRLEEADISRAVAYLEGDPRARTALARAGISARDYVLTTVALDQALVSAAAAEPATSPAAPSPGTPSPPGAASPERRPASPTTTQAATPSDAAGRTRPRITGAPPRNVELVRRNRADVVRVLRTMRFRISEPVADELTDVADTSVTRSDSVRVGKDVTVKWDVTVRRNRDTTRTKQPAGAPPDSARRDSTSQESSPP
jgi:hypothetical protein